MTQCIQAGPDCKGEVQPRSYGSRLRTFDRCEFHHGKRLAKEQEIAQQYPTLPPDDFDPMDAGERWDEE
jgi:hypothetical protein